MHVREFRLLLAREKCADALGQRVGALLRLQRSSSARCAGRQAPRSNPAPATTSASVRPGLLGQLAHARRARDRHVSPTTSFGSGVPAGNRFARHVAVCAPITPSRNAPSDRAQRRHGKAVAHRLVSGKPQSRHAMKLAKSTSEYAPLSTPAAISPRRSSSTRPFHIAGFCGAQLREMRVDLGAALVGERPRRRLEPQIKTASAE